MTINSQRGKSLHQKKSHRQIKSIQSPLFLPPLSFTSFDIPCNANRLKGIIDMIQYWVQSNDNSKLYELYQWTKMKRNSHWTADLSCNDFVFWDCKLGFYHQIKKFTENFGLSCKARQHCKWMSNWTISYLNIGDYESVSSCLKLLPISSAFFFLPRIPFYAEVLPTYPPPK